MKITGDDVIFNTGKKQYANNGIIGISPSLSVCTGYDDGYFENGLTVPERKELADYMIKKWEKFKDE